MRFSFRRKKDMPDGLWMRCEGCEKPVFKKAVEERLQVCPECGYHFRVSARERLGLLLDDGTFEERDMDLTAGDPLEFVDSEPYTDRLARHQEKSGLQEAIITGCGRINGRLTCVGVMDFNFMGASMGCVVGEKVTRIVEHATESGLPLTLVCASGGARMQEGILSLMQMAKTSAALAEFHESGGLYIAVLTNPTTAGVLASFASLADVTIAEPKALIGFTGARVIKETIKKSLPKGFQTAEFLLDHGFIDRIVERADLKDEIAKIMDYCLEPMPIASKEEAEPEESGADDGENDAESDADLGPQR